MYCSVQDAYRKAGITSTEVAEADVIEHIKEAELDVDRLTNTTYWCVEHSGTATAGSSTTLTDTTAEFGSNNEHAGDYLWIYSGTGSSQLVKIQSHTNTAITVTSAFTTNPSTDSKYRVIHTASNPIKTDRQDGKNPEILYTDRYPIRNLVSVTIDGTSVTPGNIAMTEETGELYLDSDCEVTAWTTKKPKLNVVTYWYGVYETTKHVQSLTALYAARGMLNQQMGGTHNIPSGYSMPEGSVTIGQAYVNIKGTVDVIERQIKALEQKIRKYPAVW